MSDRKSPSPSSISSSSPPSSTPSSPSRPPEGLEAYAYELPPELIAQAPLERREDSRLLVLERASGERRHARFRDVGAWLREGDLLILNDTRVFPTRLRARRPSGGRVELLLLEPRSGSNAWRALARPLKSLREGEVLAIEGAPGTQEPTPFNATFLGRDEDIARVELRRGDLPLDSGGVHALCEAVGEVPLPPYIERPAGSLALDRERYQTVYASAPGAAAAPTAGLHFSTGLLAALEAQGVRRASLTLHVGLGTFRPLSEEALRADTLHSEAVEIPETSVDAIESARRERRRIVAVGTTSARALESYFLSPSRPHARRTDLFIKPGHAFRGVDALITNFHLPRSSLLVLVSAFAGRERILECYREAVQEGYRFFSYGDAMLIV